MTGTVHVIGAGMAGLSAATAAAEAGRRVVLYEAAGHAGGRCRSFHDETLGTTIDNGNHLLLSGNASVAAYTARIGSADRLSGPVRARFPFMDLATGRRWTVDLGCGRWPAWAFSRSDRVPGTRAFDYLSIINLLRAKGDLSVEQCLASYGTLYERFWKPIAVAVLNTEPERAAAALMAPVMRETVARGGAACRPLVTRAGLSDAFVEPAIAFLGDRGATVRFAARLRALTVEPGRPPVLRFADHDVDLDPDDRAILAAPPWAVASLLPTLSVPNEHRAIVNAHFRLPRAAPAPPGDPPFIGLLGGVAEWLFVRGEIASVTVSAARSDLSAHDLAAAIWPDIGRALGLGHQTEVLPPHRMIIERRATFAQTPEQIGRRPRLDAAPPFILAGDWTDTGLPATIEGALRSGERAAALALSRS